jgi:Predicted transcriptional regulators
MYTMKQMCDKLEISYETLRFYCNEGLVPNVKRDKNNYRKFGEKDLNWLKGLLCLRDCGMSVRDMKMYMKLCMCGYDSIGARQKILHERKEKLLEQMEQLQKNVDFIDEKQQYFEAVLRGDIPYTSNLMDL